MALADPQSITVSGTTTSLPRVNTGSNTSSYSNPDGSIQLIPAHQYAKRTRRSIKLNLKKTITDPNTPANTVPRSAGINIVFDVPADGTYTPAEMLAAYKGLVAQLAASTDAVITKFLGGEN